MLTLYAFYSIIIANLFHSLIIMHDLTCAHKDLPQHSPDPSPNRSPRAEMPSPERLRSFVRNLLAQFSNDPAPQPETLPPPSDRMPMPEELRLSAQQLVLLYAPVHRDEHAIDGYEQHGNHRIHMNFVHTEEEFMEAFRMFVENPKDFQGYCRLALFNIMSDEKITLEQRLDRLDRYMDAYFDLICQMDAACFVHDENIVYEGTPEYIPDGFSEMGKQQIVQTIMRTREKSHVDKRAIFAQAKPLFMSVFGNEIRDKHEIAERVAVWVHRHLPFDHRYFSDNLGGGSIDLHEMCDPKKPKAVCRHQALYAQVLLQAFGLTSRLLKCVTLGHHAANLVRVNSKWHILDATKTRSKDGELQAFMPEIGYGDIDVTKQDYSWTVNNGDGDHTYNSRNDMFYRII